MPATRDTGGGACAEEAVSFGAEESLVGILSRPADPGTTLPAVLCLSAGVIHRVGPHRLHVELTRRLAARGFHALRLDGSGIGDSRLLGGASSFRARAVEDARAAMDRVAALTGTGRFVLFGLCSGAQNAIPTALADDRVVGMVLVDGYSYVTLRAKVRVIVAKARSLGAFPFLARGATRAIERFASRLRAERPRSNAGDGSPSSTLLGQQLETLLARGVRILAAYSGSRGDHYNHPDQLFEALPRLRGRVEVRYFPEANHTFTDLAERARLMASVDGWLERQFR